MHSRAKLHFLVLQEQNLIIIGFCKNVPKMLAQAHSYIRAFSDVLFQNIKKQVQN